MVNTGTWARELIDFQIEELRRINEINMLLPEPFPSELLCEARSHYDAFNYMRLLDLVYRLISEGIEVDRIKRVWTGSVDPLRILSTLSVLDRISSLCDPGFGAIDWALQVGSIIPGSTTAEAIPPPEINYEEEVDGGYTIDEAWEVLAQYKKRKESDY